MKIICTEQEKNIFEKIFNDENAECPFNGYERCGGWKDCSKCIENVLSIKWEVID